LFPLARAAGAKGSRKSDGCVTLDSRRAARKLYLSWRVTRYRTVRVRAVRAVALSWRRCRRLALEERSTTRCGPLRARGRERAAGGRSARRPAELDGRSRRRRTRRATRPGEAVATPQVSEAAWCARLIGVGRELNSPWIRRAGAAGPIPARGATPARARVGERMSVTHYRVQSIARACRLE